MKSPAEIVNWALGNKNESNPDDLKKQRIALQDKADAMSAEASKEFKANGRSKKFLELAIATLKVRIQATEKQQDWYKAKGGEDSSPAAKVLKTSLANYKADIEDHKKEMADKKEDLVSEMTSPGIATMDRVKARIESKPVKDQLQFYKSFSDKLQALFMDEAPSADSKFSKFARDIKSSFMDMLGGEEEGDGALEVDDMEDEEESLSDIIGDDLDDEDFTEEDSEDDGDLEDEEDEVEEATKKVSKKKVVKKSPYADKIAKLKAKIAGLAEKKKNVSNFIKSTKEDVKGTSTPETKAMGKKQIEQAMKKKKALTNEIIGSKGALNTFRVMNKKWKEKQAAKK